MDLKKMYKGQMFSPTAVITTNISATDTMIPVNDVDAFPDAPNIATIGVDVGAETIIYNDKTSTMLSGCVRGVEGIAKDWEEGTVIGRNFTAKDHGDMVDNIEELAEGKLDAEFKVEVTNSNEIGIEGKALDATQNNKDIEGSLAYRIENIEMPKGTILTLDDLDLKDSDFSNEDLSENLKKIITKMGENKILVDVTSNGKYPNIGQSISANYSNIYKGGTFNIITSDSAFTANTMHYYPNNSTEIHYFNWDNELRYGGKLIAEEQEFIWSGDLRTATNNINIRKNITAYNYLIIGTGAVSVGTYMCTNVYEYDYPSKIRTQSKMRVFTGSGGHIIIEFPTATTMNISGEFTDPLRKIIGVKRG